MGDETKTIRDQWAAGFDGLTQGPARLVIAEWRRFFVQHGIKADGICRSARRAMRAAAEETLKARDSKVSTLESRIATLEAELARLRAQP